MSSYTRGHFRYRPLMPETDGDTCRIRSEAKDEELRFALVFFQQAAVDSFVETLHGPSVAIRIILGWLAENIGDLGFPFCGFVSPEYRTRVSYLKTLPGILTEQMVEGGSVAE